VTRDAGALMNRSTERILTTHVGSLPRPLDLLAMMRARERGEPVDPQAYSTRVRTAVAEVVRKQIDRGVDIVDDGEMGKPGFIHYANERLAGFEPNQGAAGSPWKNSREVKSFPEFYEWFGRVLPSPAAGATHMVCTGPISYKGHQHVQADIANLKAALGGSKVVDVFMPAISPTSVEDWQTNRYYKTREEYLFAIAEAMREEYKAIVDAGFIVQVDDPHIATCYVIRADMSVEDVRRWAEVRVEALNHALRGIPRDRVRWHTCYGINIGPRVHDLELKHFIDIMLKVRAGALSFEAANPRHEHEWRVWENVKLPDGMVLIPGTITQSSVLVEHPELVAERIVKFARIVGRENVIAGADCGFGTFAGSEEIHESVVWAKFGALVEGARIASRQLWGRA
jgi:5-methyltetrahydropteroyltriglutamate--homocysteine methyltransferase